MFSRFFHCANRSIFQFLCSRGFSTVWTEAFSSSWEFEWPVTFKFCLMLLYLLYLVKCSKTLNWHDKLENLPYNILVWTHNVEFMISWELSSRENTKCLNTAVLTGKRQNKANDISVCVIFKWLVSKHVKNVMQVHAVNQSTAALCQVMQVEYIDCMECEQWYNLSIKQHWYCKQVVGRGVPKVCIWYPSPIGTTCRTNCSYLVKYKLPTKTARNDL